MNYESEFQGIMIDSLKRQYGILDETVLYHYFALRFFINHEGKNINKNRMAREMMLFLCLELNLPGEKSFLYKDIEIKKEVAVENSLLNIVESWIFENSIRYVQDGKGNKFSMELYLEEEAKKIMRQASNKAKLYKNTNHYEWHWKYHALNILNTVYNVKPLHPTAIDDIKYPDSDDVWLRTMEEVSEAFVHASGYLRNDVKTVTEQELENYLYTKLQLIEDGMIYIDRQVHIVDGRIDILAKDKSGTYCIIELKVADDKEIVWQCMYYPMQLKKKYGVTHVRMITIAPSYAASILMPLQSLGYVEILKFTPKVKLGKIESLYIHSVKMNAVA
jgi:hypothetical protein